MKSIFKITPVALAVTAVFASPVFADSESNGNGRHHGPYKLENRASVDLDTKWKLKNDITVWGGALAIGIIPIGDRFTMGPKLAAMACQRFFSFETVIPCHYGTFPLLHGTAGDFVARMEDSTTEVVVPERGVAIEL